ncbi:putative disease resistance RPP13-like protein 3 [Carex rostrata]
MAETIVKCVLEKLFDVAVKELLLIHGIDEQVEKVRRDLERIQAFLKDADKKHITDERQKHWVKEVRDVAHLIEDVIDTFLLEVPSKSTGSTGIRKAMKKFIKKTEKLPAVRKLADEINEIQKRMEEIKASRETFGINNLGEGTGVITLPVRPPVIPDIDPNVVGFKKDLDHVANLLLDETVKRRYVISIWGVGGLGKTTLAHKVYNREDVKMQFELRIWIDISQKFELIDILRKIGEQLGQPNNDGSLSKLHQSLRGKKYLIVLDDVWTNDLWTQIGEALPEENNGSRVLLSTRSFNVAKHADPACDPYELGLLTKELSLELLLKRALPCQDPTKIANCGLSDIIDQFVHKCNGLPIALVLLGSLLAMKPLNYATWSKVLQTMSWFADGNKIIGTSYEDLPFGLKSCFMYFAAFPEDYDIEAITLLRMWIAEGFIPKEDKRTLEETAESFLEDLVQRSLVQVTSRSADGSIEYCRIHDLLRDLALQKAKEDDFLIVYSHPDDQHNLCMARRVAVHNSDCDELVMSKNLRTLLCFGTKCMPNCSKQRMLKLVSIERLPRAMEINLKKFEGLTQLRYLDLGNYIRENRSWGEMIGNMKFLQTVSTMGGNHQLRLSGHKALRHVTGFQVELHSSAKLPNLQTLVGVQMRWESWEAPYVPNLRTFQLTRSFSSCETADAFLSTLENLISLSLNSLNTCLSFNGKLDMRDFPFYQNLQSLTLISDSKKLIDTPIDMPPHLTYLSLWKLKFRQDIMPALEKLQYLKQLWLNGIDTNEKMCCSAKGFSQLELLSIRGNDSLKDWEIEEGAMPILRKLVIRLSRNFCVPQGLRYLTNLQELEWLEWSNDPQRANEIRNLCKHVPSVFIR